VTFLRQAADLLRAARRPTALTGAGISTPSGIPDFRSHGSGLWEKHDPMQVASLISFRYQPEGFFAWIRPLAERILLAEPNQAHVALARLEAAGRMLGVVTQNIDDLHQRAGSTCVLEVHGHLRTATCCSCYRQTRPMGCWPNSQDRIRSLPVVWGLAGRRPLRRTAPQESATGRALLAGGDLLLVAGSSLEVTPVSGLPQVALAAGARLIIVNREPTYLDIRADVVLHEDVIDVLPSLADEVLRD
jgi:NAD-dependent deacetylase